MQELLSNATILLAVVGCLAFIVSVITQVIKGIFKNVPTDLVVFVLSIALTVTALSLICSISNLKCYGI